MEKNTVWAIALSVLFLIVWYHFFAPAPPPPRQKLVQTAQESSVQSGQVSPASVRADAPSTSSTVPGKSGAVQKQNPETERIIDLPSERIVIGSRGAGVKHWWLKENGGQSSSTHSATQWPDLVNHAGHAESGGLLPPGKWPLTTYPELNFEPVSAAAIAQGSVYQSVWKTTLLSGIELEKKYVWDLKESGKATPLGAVVLTFRNPGKKESRVESFGIGWTQGLGTIESEQKENAAKTRVIAYPTPTKEVAKLQSGEHKQDYHWVAVDNRYYLFAMIPQRGQFDLIAVHKDKTNSEAILTSDAFGLLPGRVRALELPFYAGPKGYTQLKKRGMGLEHAVDFGYFAFLGKWALKALYTIHGVTRNYGWSIILLTMVLQILLLPLSIKSYKSMSGMKKIQPRIQDLQKRYKEDAKRMNEEMIKLYKEAGTNPFGGCLPMIVQIPVFWAFYTMLRDAYELRGAPWILWIQDLSQRDPHYVLPVVMGGGMLLQQRISGPPGGDPAQAKMMMMMPVIFTFMFLKFPSGMVLYWLTNSMLSMTVQYLCNRKFNAIPAKTV